MNVHDTMKEREKAKRFFDALDTSARMDLGDALVLGTFDWHEWGLRTKPSSAFLNHVDYLRILWMFGERKNSHVEACNF